MSPHPTPLGLLHFIQDFCLSTVGADFLEQRQLTSVCTEEYDSHLAAAITQAQLLWEGWGLLSSSHCVQVSCRLL